MGFIVNEDGGIVTEHNGELVDVRKHLHEKLDEVITLAAAGGGAECRVTLMSEGKEHTIRLTLCDFTGEELCESCDGTGVKSLYSETSH